MPTLASKTEPRIFVAWQGFSGPAGTCKQGERIRSDHPIYLTAPENFVEDGILQRDWPSVHVRAAETAAGQEAAEVAAAEANPLKLERPAMFRSTRDVIAYRDGRLALILKGSIVLDGDELLAASQDAWEPVR